MTDHSTSRCVGSIKNPTLAIQFNIRSQACHTRRRHHTKRATCRDRRGRIELDNVLRSKKKQAKRAAARELRKLSPSREPRTWLVRILFRVTVVATYGVPCCALSCELHRRQNRDARRQSCLLTVLGFCTSPVVGAKCSISESLVQRFQSRMSGRVMAGHIFLISPCLVGAFHTRMPGSRGDDGLCPFVS
jgi:hypothetical protein